VATAKNIQQLLAVMKTHGASDLHLKAGLPPTLRVKGHLKLVTMPAMSGADIEAILNPIIPAERRAHFDEHGSVDFATELPDGDRFRCNVFRASGKMGAAIRRVNPVIPTYAELHLPPILEKTVSQTFEGILIVCGVTGSGKSTTIARMIEQINETRSENIVTLEDPIEYQFKPKKSIISQREMGVDLIDFAEGLRSVVRQDPDVIFIGELRDLVTMRAAIQSAETGHLVFASMHSADTTQAFARLLEFFPENERSFVRTAVSNTLRAIFAQRLLPGAREDAPLIPATEALINTPSLKELVRKEQENEIPDLIAGSENEGMHSFTSSLAQLVEEDWVFMDTAMQYAPNAEALASRLRGIKASGQTMVQRSR
jgi:twitching motility protein PilT